MDIRKELFDVIGEYVELPEGGLDTSANMKMSAGIDSFTFISMVSSIEDHFQVAIPNNQLISFKSLDDIIAYISKARG